MANVSWASHKRYVDAINATYLYIRANCPPRWNAHAIRGEELAPAIVGWIGILMDDANVWRGYVWADKVELFDG